MNDSYMSSVIDSQDYQLEQNDKEIAQLKARVAELERQNYELQILSYERGQFIINGEDLGYISVPTSENDKAYHVFMRCKCTKDYAGKKALLDHDAEIQAQAIEGLLDNLTSYGYDPLTTLNLVPNLVGPWVDRREIKVIRDELRQQAKGE